MMLSNRPFTAANLGHNLYRTNQWQLTRQEPIPHYVLADLYSWPEAHSELRIPLLLPLLVI